MWKRRYQEFFGLALICLSTLFLVSVISYHSGDYFSLANNAQVNNAAGPLGAWISHILRLLFGRASYIVIAVLVCAGIFLFRHRWMRRPTEKAILLLLLAASGSSLMSLFVRDLPQMSGGEAGLYITATCKALFGETASYILLSGIALSSCILLLLMLLYADHKRVQTTAGFSGRLLYPWIIKKKIIVYETEKYDLPVDLFRFPELSDPPQQDNRALVYDGAGSPYPALPLKADGADFMAADSDLVLRDCEYFIDKRPAPVTDEDRTDGYKDDEAEQDYSAVNPDTADAGGGEGIDESAIDQDLTEMPDQAAGSAHRDDFEERVFEKITIPEEYSIPTSLLISTKPYDSESWKSEIRRNSALLKKTLAEFGIEAEVMNVNRGPVITLYEMQIAPGIKVNRVVSLADDIAMALAAHRVRIVAPIPGKSAIGVEIPNHFRETVTLGDIVKSKEFRSFKGSLAVALGKDILGSPVMLDLKRLPHLLIAGATGAGKSVCVNSIIMSLLYNYDPNCVRFIMMDPKIVELQLYNGLPHLLTPVIIDPQMASMVLKWTLHEMERRYYLLSELNTRDIERYNEKIERSDSAFEKLPYIVVVIDEMADLMMTSKDVEGYITRIAQKARAVGIHLVVATQRPSVDIITGIIKANFPARIAFQVAQKTDSRTIIDQNGAEKLLGRGDMLYQSPISSFPIRVQGGFISEEEIEKVVAHLCTLGRPSYIDVEQTLYEEEESEDSSDATDELFQEAMKIVEETKKASASYLQRRLSIGYNRAARIIEQMEEMGYIGPQIGSKPREIFI